MSSQALSQRPPVGPASFPLSKFSFATVSGELVKPIPWTHISDKGHLFAVFENVAMQKYNGEVEESSQFKVLAEPDVMEDLNLPALGREAMNAVQEMKTTLSTTKVPAVTIIIQEPCIAVRFPLQHGQIRRFQMKFKLESDFYKALALFSQAGCPFTQAGSLAPQPQLSRPSTASSAITPGSLACQSRENLRQAPSTADSDQGTLVPSLCTSIHSSSRPSTSSSSMWKSELGASMYSNTAYDTNKGPPYPEKALVSPFFSESNRAPTVSDQTFHQQEKSSPAQHQAPRHPSFPSSSDPVAAAAGRRVNSGHHTASLPFGTIKPRPSTAPTFESQRLSQMLPPKRELPFKVSRTTLETSRGEASSSAAPANASVNSSGNPEVTKKPPAKRATKSTRATRNAPAASRSRKKVSIPEDNSSVPSVEELLHRAQRLPGQPAEINHLEDDANKVSVDSISSAATGFGNVSETGDPQESVTVNYAHAKEGGEQPTTYQYSNIDTQALLARVDERQSRQRTKRKDVTEALNDPTLQHPSKRIASVALLDMAALLPSGDRVELPTVSVPEAATRSVGVGGSNLGTISSLATATNVGAFHGYHSRDHDVIPTSAQTPVEEMSASSIDAANTTPPERGPLANITNIAQLGCSHTTASISMVALMNNPDFAKSPEIAQWADLPAEERDATLETWMCQQLECESFATLTRTLEGMWQRIFFGG